MDWYFLHFLVSYLVVLEKFSWWFVLSIRFIISRNSFAIDFFYGAWWICLIDFNFGTKFLRDRYTYFVEKIAS